MKFALPLLLLSASAEACPSCRPLVEAKVFDPSFGSTLALLVLPLALVGAISALLYFAEPLWERKQ